MVELPWSVQKLETVPLEATTNDVIKLHTAPCMHCLICFSLLQPHPPAIASQAGGPCRAPTQHHNT